jgi:hypothetical protein
MLSLNSTVWYSLNTSGVAPANSPPTGPPPFPPVPSGPTRGRTLVLLHQGHNGPCVLPEELLDVDTTVSWLNQLGYDVMNLNMPLYGPNAPPAGGPPPCNHSWFRPLDEAGVPVFRFFLEPVFRAVSYAVDTLGYEHVVLAGFSGGGWTTTVAAALDPRIRLSVPIAGSMPCGEQRSSQRGHRPSSGCFGSGHGRPHPRHVRSLVILALHRRLCARVVGHGAGAALQRILALRVDRELLDVVRAGSAGGGSDQRAGAQVAGA